MPSLNLEKLQENLNYHLSYLLPHHSIAQGYQYAVFPPGKLFRPQLVQAIAFDFTLTQQKQHLHSWDKHLPHAYLASLVELHHAYTLVHDDLPEMDNDEIRREKPATHIAFGQWQALLIGDGLLSISYQLLKHLPSDKLSTILALMGHLLGPKGLIQGQVLDLSEEMKKNFTTLLTTHTLKTARLIQFSIVSSFLLLAQQNNRYRTAIKLYRLGHAMGIVFQLLDDLTELEVVRLNDHEQQINPWLRFSTECMAEVLKQAHLIQQISNEFQLQHFRQVLDLYYSKIRNKMEQGKTEILNHLSVSSLTEKHFNELYKLLQLT